MLHPSRMRMVRLPPRQLNQRLILFGLLALEAVHPGQPPVPTFTLLIAAHVTLIALAVRHLESLLPLKIPHLLQRYRQRAAGSVEPDFRPQALSRSTGTSATPHPRCRSSA